IQTDLHKLRRRTYARSVRKLQSKIEAFENGGLSPEAYISYLIASANEAGVSVDQNYPLVTRFLRNPDLFRDADLDQVFHQADELAYRLKLQRANPGKEKDLVRVERDLSL